MFKKKLQKIFVQIFRSFSYILADFQFFFSCINLCFSSIHILTVKKGLCILIYSLKAQILVTHI